MPTKKILKASSQYPELSQKSHLFPSEIRQLFRNSKLIDLSLPNIDRLTENLRHPPSPTFPKQLKKLRLLTTIQEKQISLLLDQHPSSPPSSPSSSPSSHLSSHPSISFLISSSLPSSLPSSHPSSLPYCLPSSLSSSSLLPINDENFGVATFQRERNIKMQPLDPLSENQVYQIDKDRREKLKKREEGGLKWEEGGFKWEEGGRKEEEEGDTKENEEGRKEEGWRKEEEEKMRERREEGRREERRRKRREEEEEGLMKDEGYLWGGMGYGLGRALLSDKVEDLMDLRIERRLVDVEEEDWGWEF